MRTSTVMLIAGGAWIAAKAGWPVFHHEDELAALGWLRCEAPLDEVALATFEQANVIPAYAGLRVYAGHGPETVDARRKRPEMEDFFGAGMRDDKRAALLDESRARYVFAGPVEAGFCEGTGCFEAEALGLKQVYQQGDYTIYEVPQ